MYKKLKPFVPRRWKYLEISHDNVDGLSHGVTAGRAEAKRRI
jgi:hypothetical protein